MKERITRDLQNALRRKEALRLSTLRMMLAELQTKEKEKGLAVTPEAAVQVLRTMVRKRRDAIEQFRAGGREELAEKESCEIVIIEEYLPALIGEDDLRVHVQAAIAETGAAGMKAMGAVMATVMKKLSGQVDGTLASRIVREELQKLQQ